MKITGIEEVSKSRSKIDIDNEFAFVLYKGELRLYQIVLGEEISEKAYREIMKEVLPKRAKLRAITLLTKRDYTTARLREKLVQGGYPASVVEEALEYVASFHYVDDLRYAVQYLETYSANRSKRRIQQDLYGRGISKDTVAEAFRSWEEQGGEQDELSMIHALLQKRGYLPEKADAKERQKQYGFLARKGFSQESIRRALQGNDYFEEK